MAAVSLLFHDAGVLGAGDPADEPGGGDVHDKAFDGERNEAEIAGDGHFEDFPVLKHGENVVPLGRGPIIPEFPQPSADPS